MLPAEVGSATDKQQLHGVTHPKKSGLSVLFFSRHITALTSVF